MTHREPGGRKPIEIRPLTIETGVNRYAEGSTLIKCGNTHVLCTASIEETVPGWLAGKGRGWLTAEYSMLPRATHTRGKRDREKVSGRTQEIQRLIGRALRACVDLKLLGERTLMVDCDVLQADGGTRTSSITGACVAVAQALRKLQDLGKLAPNPSAGPWTDTVAAISVGLKSGEVLVDLDYNEDSGCDVDMNFVVTGQGLLVEVQGTAEKSPFSPADLDRMLHAAQNGIEQIKLVQAEALRKIGFTL